MDAKKVRRERDSNWGRTESEQKGIQSVESSPVLRQSLFPLTTAT